MPTTPSMSPREPDARMRRSWPSSALPSRHGWQRAERAATSYHPLGRPPASAHDPAMTIDGQTDDAIRAILETTRRIALVGASAKSWRPSHGVMRFLLDRGYDVTPVNPGIAGQAIHG